LSKVSLWLRTLAAEQPLAFLDHHLKTGNSLVGSDIEEIEELESESGGDEKNASLADFGVARKGTIEQLMRIYEDFIAIENQELADVKEMEAKYDEFERNQLRQRLEAMANVKTAENFGLDVIPDGAFEDMAAALEDDNNWKEIASSEWFKHAQSWADDNRYFHWKLEYPEVFYTEEGEPKSQDGFDAVIGNPPYIIFKMLSDEIRDYYRDEFDTFKMKGDIYVLFIERASGLLRDGGKTGYIVQNKFMKAKYGTNLRSHISSNETIQEVIDFHDSPVFDISAYPLILLREKGEPPEGHNFQWRDIRESDTRRIESELNEGTTSWQVNQDDLGSNVWHPFVSDGVVSANTVSIEEFAEQIGRGAAPGNTEVYLVDDETISEYDLEEKYIKRVLRGGDIDKFRIEDPDNLSQLIYPYDVRDGEPELVEPSQIPGIISYLENYKSELLERKNYGKRLVDQGYEWYELTYNSPGMLNNKIVFPDISPENRFASDKDGEFACLDTVYYLVRDNSLTSYSSNYLTAVLNSNLLEYLFDRMSPKVRGGYYRYKSQYVEDLPVPAIDFSNRHTLEGKKVNEITELCEDVADVVISHRKATEELESTMASDIVKHDTLTHLADEISERKHEKESYNLNLMDYLGSYSDGKALSDLQGYQPAPGVSDTPLAETTESKNNLRVGELQAQREGRKIVIEATSRYKPEDAEDFETDRWGYTETGFLPVMEFIGMNEAKMALIEVFIPYAADEDDGFANYRENATKRNSLVDRIEALTLPKFADVEDGLESYLRQEQNVHQLDEELDRLNRFMNEIIYTLFELEDEEIDMVENSLSEV
jgi:hypothetical protein